MTLGEKILMRRKELGLSQARLAVMAGTKQSSISAIERGHVSSSREIVGIAKALGVDPETFRPPTIPGDPSALAARLCPLISWVAASAWGDANDPFVPGDADEWLPAPTSAGRSSYFLRVRGDSMTGPAGRMSYPEGSYICVDPDKRSPSNGQHVIARLANATEVTFKQFVSEDGQCWLKPLNVQYQPILDPFEILGTVIAKLEIAP